MSQKNFTAKALGSASKSAGKPAASKTSASTKSTAPAQQSRKPAAGKS